MSLIIAFRVSHIAYRTLRYITIVPLIALFTAYPHIVSRSFRLLNATLLARRLPGTSIIIGISTSTTVVMIEEIPHLGPCMG